MESVNHTACFQCCFWKKKNQVAERINSQLYTAIGFTRRRSESFYYYFPSICITEVLQQITEVLTSVCKQTIGTECHFRSFHHLSSFHSENVLLHKSTGFLMGKPGMWLYHCPVRHVLENYLHFVSFLCTFKSLFCFWHWVAKSSEFNDCFSLIISRGIWTPNFQWSVAEDWREVLWWHLIKTSKDLLRVQIMRKFDLSMWMDNSQHLKLLTEKISHKNSQEQPNTLTWQDTACLRWTITWAVLFEASFTSVSINIHKYICSNKRTS